MIFVPKTYVCRLSGAYICVCMYVCAEGDHGSVFILAKLTLLTLHSSLPLPRVYLCQTLLFKK